MGSDDLSISDHDDGDSSESLEGFHRRQAAWLHGIGLVNSGKMVGERRYILPRVNQKLQGAFLTAILFILVGSLVFQGYAFASQTQREYQENLKRRNQGVINILIGKQMADLPLSADERRALDRAIKETIEQ